MSTKKKGIYDKDMNFSIKPSTLPPKTASASASASAPTQASTNPSLFFTKKSKLITVPPVVASVVAATVANNEEGSKNSSFLRYMLVFFVLGFLGLSLYLYLEKPVETDIKNLYDPVLNYLGFTTTPAKGAARGAAPTTPAKGAAVDKLEKAVNEKKVINNIDKTDAEEEEEEEENIVQIKRDFKKPPVIPKADDSTGQMHKPKSKSGFCYIGEDRGFRSCISVEEGDVCMSGDIFPTQAVCINPNLRE